MRVRFKGYRRAMKNELSRWAKGYLQERLLYKAEYHYIDITMVNPVYTSQLCYSCQHFGQRQGQVFTCSNKDCHYYHEEQDAAVNAAKNIKNRKGDSEISVYMSAPTVKNLLETRIS